MFNRLNKFIIFDSNTVSLIDKKKNHTEQLSLNNLEIDKIINFAESSKIGIFLTNTIADVFSISVKNEDEIELEIEKYLGEEASDLVWDYKQVGLWSDNLYQITAIKPEIVEIINDLTERNLNISFVEPISYVLLRKYKNNPALSLIIYSNEFQNSIILIENGAVKFDLPYEQNHINEQLAEVKNYLKKSNTGYMEPIHVNYDIFSDASSNLLNNRNLKYVGILLVLAIVVGVSLYVRSTSNTDAPIETPIVSEELARITPTPTVEPTNEPVIEPTINTVDYQSYKIIILNGSGIPGEAAKTAETFKNSGFKDPDIGNYPAGTITQTTIRLKPGIDSSVITGILGILKDKKPVLSEEKLDAEGPYDIQIIVGENITGE
jgi:hypothetical protein